MTTRIPRPFGFATLLLCLTTLPACAAEPGARPTPAPTTAAAATAAPVGYYRFPALADDAVIFAAEGDLWRVPLSGGTATRITSHPGEESYPVVSPDGKTLAFSAEYEGPVEVYTMPLAGGTPTRRTYMGQFARPTAFSPDGDLVIATRAFSTLPATQLVSVNLETGALTPLPLAQASDATFDPDGNLFFTRLDFQGSHTRRYEGGTAQQIWSFALPRAMAEHQPARPTLLEAHNLTADYPGTSSAPMFWNGRVYFRTDRDAAARVMNIWSMTLDGKDLRQHTRHTDFDVQTPSLRNGKIAYKSGADIWLLDLGNDQTRKLDITLSTDLDQTREKWVAKPFEMVSAAHLSPDGDKVAITARGQVFVAPRKFGRLVEATRRPGVRYRDARFMKNGEAESLVTFSDQSGEVEIWTMPTDGLGDASQLTSDGDILRWQAIPSPDGKRIAHHDKNRRLWVYDVEKKTNTKIDENSVEDFSDLAWSPDSRFLAYAANASNLNPQIKLYSTIDGSLTFLTSDRTASSNPSWDPAGKYLYFLSERNLQSVTRGPWGLMQPEPFFDKRSRIYALGLQPGLRPPFAEPDELQPKKSDDKKDGDKKDAEKKDGEKKGDDDKKDSDKPAKKEPKPVEVVLAGIQDRVYTTPFPPENYSDLAVNEKALFFTMSSSEAEPKVALAAVAIDADAMKKREWKIETILPDIRAFELSANGKTLLARTKTALIVADAEPKKIEDASKVSVDLSGWSFSLVPREEWRQMYNEAWRLHRDYFYDRDMHGVDWKAVRAKYAPLADRVVSRADLSDVLGQMIAELSALHHFVRGGDMRQGPDQVTPASLGARLERDPAQGGYVIRTIYRPDPDRTEARSPLVRPDLDIKEGDILEKINGVPTLSVADPAVLLRNQADKQVLIHTKRAGGEPRPAIIKPIAMTAERELRWNHWREERRKLVEDWGKGDIGYVHLQAMGARDIAEFARQYYPVFNRKALVIDVRNNGGGNIDPWVLERLMRKAWFFWQPRIGEPYWSMQYAFRGHMAVLCNEYTGSDGEAFTEGFRRLGLGKVYGTRTWGGEIWLSSSNILVDNGIASAAENGVYGPEGTWLIEGHGVDPDVVVDNPPYAAFKGEDAQLKAVVEHLQQRLKDQPVQVPPAPKHPNKAFSPK